MDLHHLARNVASATGKGRIADACRDVQQMIDGDEARSPIIAEGRAGSAMAPARGISIYFPLFLDRSTFYRELDFASATHWADPSTRVSGTDGRVRLDEGPRRLGRGAIGSWGGWHPSLGGYVTGTGATMGATAAGGG